MKRTALLLVDFINDLTFDGADLVLPRAMRAARRTAALRARRSLARVPVIYANDNFGRWRSDFKEVVARCCSPGCPGAPLARLLSPRKHDHFVLKPKNSGFFQTPLELLLRQLKVHRLIIAGVAADNCVLFTANDAYLHGYELWIPADCIAAESATIERQAIGYFRRVLKADVRPTTGGNR